MLKNELAEIEKALFEQSYSDSNKAAKTDIDILFKQVRRAWEEAVFSNISESQLMRYFQYHLDIITSICNSLHSFKASEEYEIQQNKLLSLVDHLRKYYSGYFNDDASAPMAYQIRAVCKSAGSIDVIKKTLKASKLSPALIDCVFKWLTEICENTNQPKVTFRSLHYFERLISQIALITLTSDDGEHLLISLLSCSNFNHLSFFVFWQQKIREISDSHFDYKEKLIYLNKEKAEILSFPEIKNIAYDPSWPSIRTMIGDWLQEEILLTEKYLSDHAEFIVPKLQLETSVAHMSCIIRLLYEEGVFANQNLQFIFKFFSGYFQSKRQSVISPGSLSKEYYSIDQHTAARVRDLLQRMVMRINRNFFPMGVVVNATALSYLSIS